MDAWALPTTRFDQFPVMYENHPLAVLCPQYLEVLSNPKTREFAAHFSTEEDTHFNARSGFEPLDVNSALAEVIIKCWPCLPFGRNQRLVGRRGVDGKLVWSPVGPYARLLPKLSAAGKRMTLQKM